MEIKRLSSENAEIKDMRIKVFCEEQGYPKNKLFDEFENAADFLALYEQGKLVGCGRLYEENHNENGITFHIDNIAVGINARGGGLGRELVHKLTEECRKSGADRVTVNSESYAVGFYEKCGFAVCGCEFEDENLRRVPLVISFEFEGCKRLAARKGTEAYYAGINFDSDENVNKMILRLSVAGFVEPYVNGEKITDEKFIPAWSNYEKRDLSGAAYPIFDTMCQRLYYLEFDITGKVRRGRNCLLFHIGNGWYGHEQPSENMPKWGEPSIVFKLIVRMNDGSDREVCSDESVKWHESHVRRTNIYTNETIDGEIYDERLFSAGSAEFDFSSWENMKTVPEINAVMTKQYFSGDKIVRRITPELIHTGARGKMYDLKEDVSGLWSVKFDSSAVPGDKAVITVGEDIDENFDFLLRHTGEEYRKQQDVCICGKVKREFSPVFTWRGGRYIRVEGNAELIGFDIVWSPVEQTARLECENENLQWYFDAYCRTQNCNIHCMIPSDCPHRERLGYTGDGQLCSKAAMTIFDSEKMYRKWMDDIADCQDIYNGHVQHTAPFFGGGGGPGGWGGAIVIVPWNFYKHYGDVNILEKYYGRMKKYLEYMDSRSDEGIVVREEEGGWCLGDWCTPGNDIQIPPEFVNTYFHIKCTDMVKKAAEVLCIDDDVTNLKDKEERLINSFNRRFFDESTGSYCDGVQGADAFAVDISQGDDRTLDNLVNRYTLLGQYDTGIFGTDVLTRVLFEKGYGSLAFKLLTGTGENSFYNMKKHGAGTLWETWDGKESLSHPMFGACCEYIFTCILGIKQTEGSAGWKEIKIEPAYIPECGNISGSIMTPSGRICVQIKYTDGVRSIYCHIPEKMRIKD